VVKSHDTLRKETLEITHKTAQLNYLHRGISESDILDLRGTVLATDNNQAERRKAMTDHLTPAEIEGMRQGTGMYLNKYWPRESLWKHLLSFKRMLTRLLAAYSEMEKENERLRIKAFAGEQCANALQNLQMKYQFKESYVHLALITWDQFQDTPKGDA